MVIKVYWENDQKTLILIEFSEYWSLMEFKTAFYQAYHEIEAAQHMVDLIFCVPTTMNLPLGNLWLYYTWAFKSMPANIGRRICVGRPERPNKVAEVFIKSHPETNFDICYVATMEEAQAILMQGKGTS